MDAGFQHQSVGFELSRVVLKSLPSRQVPGDADAQVERQASLRARKMNAVFSKTKETWAEEKGA